MTKCLYAPLFAASLILALLASTAPTLALECGPVIGRDSYVFQCDADESDVVDESVVHEPETTSGTSPFTFPPTPDDSLFGRRTYARLADNANVYAQPSRAATVVRNVGDGYLFATVNRWFDDDAGATWYEINLGEFVHQDDIMMAEPAELAGVHISAQPERPFGWLVADTFPSHKPDGEPDEALAELTRLTFVEIYDAALGEEDWLWYEIGDGRWVKQTFLSLVDVTPPPAEVGDGEYWAEVDLYEQTFAAYEGEQMVFATLISSGLNRWPTYEGIYQVWDRWLEHKMSGAEGQVDYYFLEDIPFIMYFDELNGIALHGTYWHDRFGFKHSHGCVNMTIRDAEWIFDWSEAAPNDLWVWTHTSDPLSHLTQFE